MAMGQSRKGGGLHFPWTFWHFCGYISSRAITTRWRVGRKAELVVGVEQDTTMRNRSNLQSNSSQVRTLVRRCPPDGNGGRPIENPRARMTVDEIAHRLDVGRLAVYAMLGQGILPGVRLGRRWIVTRHAFENWERTCGMPTGLQRKTEHKVS
jgi:excisionase family DNA binding protein